MQATGLGVSGLVGLHGVHMATAQDGVIELVARYEPETPAAYTGSGDTITREGVDAAVADWENGVIGTNLLMEVVDYWSSGAQVSETETGPRYWLGSVPSEIDGQQNPSLNLTAGAEYTIQLTNETVDSHTFVIEDGSGNALVQSAEMTSRGETVSVTFTATQDMVSYYSTAFPGEMRGSIDAFDTIDYIPEPDRLNVLLLGGVEDGATHYTTEFYREIAPYMIEQNIEVVYTERQDDLDASTLSNYDAVMIYGNRFNPTTEQINSLVNYVENGGGFVPIHAASASFTSSSAYISLVGGQFSSHGNGTVQTERIQPGHVIYDGVNQFSAQEESYRHTNLNTDIDVLAYGGGADYGASENEPFTWTRTQGNGRVFYTAWGHNAVWSVFEFKQLLENGIRWASGNEDTITSHTTVQNKSRYTQDVPYYGPLGSPPAEVDTNGDGTWDQVQEPLSIVESQRRIIPSGEFRPSHFVSEQTLPAGIGGNIMDVSFDEQGRAWVAFSEDYPNNAGGGNDQIVICEDTTGDGQADTFTVFEDGLSIPYAVVPYENGAIVVQMEADHGDGHVIYLEDTNGDDVADQTTELFSGFATYDTHAGPNRLIYGIDNWIYGVVGYGGVNTTVGGQSYSFGQSVYRFRPDGSELEVVANLPTNTAGIGFNEEGLLFTSSATSGGSSHYVAIPNRYYDMVAEFSAPTLSGNWENNLSQGYGTNRIIPSSDLIRQVDFHWEFTAASDYEVYTARDYPEKYWNRTAFVGDSTANLMATITLEQDGADYTALYETNLATSDDEWFSPTYAYTGPDGMVWLVDFYDFIIQHNPTPSGYSNGSGNAYVTSLRDNAHSRLYRFTNGGSPDPHPQDLSNASATELVNALADDNMFWRLTAQRLLIERGQTDVVPDLVSLVQDTTVDSVGINGGAIHALWTLDGLGALDANGDADAISAAQNALTHPSAGVRITALRTLPATASTRDAILNNSVLTSDSDARVRQWALLKLSECPEAYGAGQSIYDMLEQSQNGSDTVIVDSATPAAVQHSSGYVDTYESQSSSSGSEGSNLLVSPSVEDTTDWSTTTYSGTATFTQTTAAAHSGSNSVEISSSSGADASWNQTVSVQSNTDYVLRGWIQTENVQNGGGGNGAQFNVHGLAESEATPAVTGTTSWTQVETTINSGSNTSLQVNALFGGWGTSTGTAYFDDIELRAVSSGGGSGANDTVYNRVIAHQNSSGDGGGDITPIDPASTITFDGDTGGWYATGPSSINGETNPELVLYEGETYTLEWTNLDGTNHNFATYDSSHTELTASPLMSTQGGTQTVTFTVDPAMTQYDCQVHPGTMSGIITTVQQ